MNNEALPTLQFSPAAALVLQGILALVIFGVALELSFADFRRLLSQPKPVFAALFSQLLVLPLLTFGLIWVLDPSPGLALGLMMTAACPGGNMSNLLTHWSGGRTSVSMSATTISSLISPITTPLTFALLGGLHPATQAALQEIRVPALELVMTIAVALMLPLLAGMTLASKKPELAKRLLMPLRRFGLIVFFGFVVVALAANGRLFLHVISTLFVLVLLHNLLAMVSGYGVGALFRVSEGERRAITFETGIHNTALGLTLVFSYFPTQTNMILVLGWWGVWQLGTGGVLAWLWARRRPAASSVYR
ncbi:bile acid:sodium symporter family protein [Stenotrophobium rhamnosiphilum]|uniref:bile acid:sodium symporter family protein n=1 Tax=Stenotrophobium rhamnosiphilum TaxID=2029166 RepID=UPI001374DCB2|nr:bile acid:sodium symporter family protein [Stenotrophobium rhamnosiphilum]